MNNEWKNQSVRISLKSGMYFKGLVLDEDDEFIYLKDFKDKKVDIRKEFILVIEEWVVK